MNYSIHSAAADEHRGQVSYYEDQQPGLGRRYHAAFRAALTAACASPQRRTVVFPPDSRRVGLRGFPLDRIDRAAQGRVQVLAVAHHRRAPGYWIGRS